MLNNNSITTKKVNPKITLKYVLIKILLNLIILYFKIRYFRYVSEKIQWNELKFFFLFFPQCLELSFKITHSRPIFRTSAIFESLIKHDKKKAKNCVKKYIYNYIYLFIINHNALQLKN